MIYDEHERNVPPSITVEDLILELEREQRYGARGYQVIVRGNGTDYQMTKRQLYADHRTQTIYL